ncbi:MAG: flagellar basal body P-ring formation protein FlgA [Thauera sp.]|nr:flagellar basal body P-ring formation protein FlgA [Thauera sp.]
MKPAPCHARRANRRSRLPAAALLAATLLLAARPAPAQQSPEPVNAAIRAFLDKETRALPGRVLVTLTPFDARNQLPACSALVPFLPAGTRAWGQISVGVRCDSPVPWTAYQHAHVAVMAEHLVTRQPLRAAQIVGPADVELRHGDLTALPDNTLTDPSQAIGHHARYAVAAGVPLRGEMLRIPPAVIQGQAVQVTSVGPGFRIAGEGKALNNAAPGESVRVRMPNGKVVTGTARAGGSVEVAF